MRKKYRQYRSVEIKQYELSNSLLKNKKKKTTMHITQKMRIIQQAFVSNPPPAIALIILPVHFTISESERYS